MKPDALSIEEEILKIVERRTAICRKIMEMIERDENSGAISLEEAASRLREVRKEMAITQSIIDRQKARLEASKKEKKD